MGGWSYHSGIDPLRCALRLPYPARLCPGANHGFRISCNETRRYPDAGQECRRVSNLCCRPVFESLPREISQALNVGATPTASTFDALLDKGQKSAREVWARAYWPVDIVTGLGGMLVIGASFAVAAIGYIVSLYAGSHWRSFWPLGPFYCTCHVPATRRFTEAWLGQLVNFVILQVLVVAIGSLLIDTIDSIFLAIEAYSDVLMRPIALCAICLAALYVFYQLPAIASALAAGGASLTYGYGAARDAHEGILARGMKNARGASGQFTKIPAFRLFLTDDPALLKGPHRWGERYCYVFHSLR